MLAAETDLKILLQDGRFTIHGSPAQISAGDADLYLVKWLINSPHKAKIRGQLDALGIGRSSLFPDLASLAADIAAKRTGPTPIPAAESGDAVSA